MTKVSEKFLDLREIFSVKNILTSLGFEIKTAGDLSDTILSKVSESSQEVSKVFDFFNSTNKRNQLLQFCHSGSNYRKLDSDVRELIDRLGHETVNRGNFSHTFEWYIGELMIRKFAAFSYAYGVEVRNIQNNSTSNRGVGDFDSLVVMRNLQLLYFECKTGSCSSTDITKAIERGISLHAVATIIILPAPIQQKSLFEEIEKILKDSNRNSPVQKLSLKNSCKSEIYKYQECFFIPAGKNIENQIKVLLRILRLNTVEPVARNYIRQDAYEKYGYLCEETPLAPHNYRS